VFTDRPTAYLDELVQAWGRRESGVSSAPGAPRLGSLILRASLDDGEEPSRRSTSIPSPRTSSTSMRRSTGHDAGAFWSGASTAWAESPSTYFTVRWGSCSNRSIASAHVGGNKEAGMDQETNTG